MMKTEQKWYLGTIKGTHERVYLYGFDWECDWYWSGGGIGNRNFWSHFDSAFLNVPDIRGHCLGNFVTPWTQPKQWQKDARIISNGSSIWEPLSTFLDDAQYSEKEWWRIKDFFKQFYSLRDAAEVFQYGGHCTSEKRNETELDKGMADKLNAHIENVIIPLIKDAMDKKEVDSKDNSDTINKS